MSMRQITFTRYGHGRRLAPSLHSGTGGGQNPCTAAMYADVTIANVSHKELKNVLVESCCGQECADRRSAVLTFVFEELGCQGGKTSTYLLVL